MTPDFFNNSGTFTNYHYVGLPLILATAGTLSIVNNL